MNRNPRRTALGYMVGIFLAGLLAGVVVGALIGHRHGSRQRTQPPAPEQMAGDVKRRLRDDLRLSEEQAQQIAPAVDRFVREMEGVQSNTVEQAVLAIRRMHERVELHLDAEQGERFRRIEREREAEFRRLARPPRE